MRKVIAVFLFAGIVAATSISASEIVVEETTEPSNWSKAGEEISEAADAVGDATADTSKKVWKTTKDGSVEAWDKTKKGTKEAWGKTKEESKELWEKGRAKLHEATAPVAPEATTE
jgi:phage-related tail protein